MVEKKFITLAIHTYDRAVALRKILETHGIEVRFENLVLTGVHIASGVRVKICEQDLPLALTLTESGDYFTWPSPALKVDGINGKVLIPVDFSAYSILACHVGFYLARRLNLHPVVMHAYATPYFMGAVDYGDATGSSDVDEMAEMTADNDIRKESEKLMRDFRKKLKELQDKGEIPAVDFSVFLNEGIPEEMILEYCRLTPPALVVMATRGKDKKEEDLVGSVTAEVIDSCRVPVLAIPEDFSFSSFESLSRVAFFCNLDQHDMISMDTLMRMFDYPAVDMTLVPVNDRAGSRVGEKVDALRDYFSKNYPVARFSSRVFPARTFREEFEDYIKNDRPEMLIVPNKKKNIFSRLFNPGIPHKILFERDIPILALPV